MPAQLLSLSDGPSLLLDKPVLLVGRHEECDIQLNSRKVSRKHCVIAQVGEALVIRDLGSTNGVRINGVRVEDGTLRTGDELAIGNFRYKVHVEQRREVLAPPKSPAAKQPGGAGHPAGSPKQPAISEDDLLEAAEEPVPLPEPIPGFAPGGRRPPQPAKLRSAGSYPMPEDLQIKPESSVHLPPPG
jgi:predicted component of type VI protein secretion system